MVQLIYAESFMLDWGVSNLFHKQTKAIEACKHKNGI